MGKPPHARGARLFTGAVRMVLKLLSLSLSFTGALPAERRCGHELPRGPGYRADRSTFGPTRDPSEVPCEVRLRLCAQPRTYVDGEWFHALRPWNRICAL